MPLKDDKNWLNSTIEYAKLPASNLKISFFDNNDRKFILTDDKDMWFCSFETKSNFPNSLSPYLFNVEIKPISKKLFTELTTGGYQTCWLCNGKIEIVLRYQFTYNGTSTYYNTHPLIYICKECYNLLPE